MILQKKKIKLESIAFDLGFDSYINFARTFKKHTKVSPKEFRDNYISPKTKKTNERHKLKYIEGRDML